MDTKDQIKQALSIVDVVSNYIHLEKSSSQFKAKCPFHNEKTPSFYVSPDRGTYHCFGCGEHGDIFSFVEKIESISFYEALTILAERAGIQLTSYRQEKDKKEVNLIDLLERATAHYEKNLADSPEAKLYLGERGLNSETIKKFNIGFALGDERGWRDLFIALSQAGFSPEEMVQSGVVVKKQDEEKYFDRFRGRIMFPIKNSLGKTVGFSARILPKYDTGKFGKYINSPETEVYHKSKILFAYDLAKSAIAREKSVILVEGQMDAIMSHQAGVENVVATSGTAVTEEQLKILKRFADKLLLSFDQDSAGEAAMKKCAKLALYANFDVYIIPKSTNVKDTAELIQTKGPEAWQKLISEKKPLIISLVDDIWNSSEDVRVKGEMIRKEVLPYLKIIESAIDRAYFIKYIAQKLNISEDDIKNDLKVIKLEETFETNLVTENSERLAPKITRVKEILAILTWRKIDLDKYLEKFLVKNELVDFPNKFREDNQNIPQEILEATIISEEAKITSNRDFLENEERFIKNELFILSKRYKLEILKEERDQLKNKSAKTEEDLKLDRELALAKKKVEEESFPEVE